MNNRASGSIDCPAGRPDKTIGFPFMSISVPRRVVVFKIACDVVFSLLALPLIVITAVLLLLLNPFFNRGPLLFSQDRMGKDGIRFRMWKFRTMLPDSQAVRAHDEELEHHRITKMGRILRKSRIDELPNFFNVLAGQMSVIGPRPDAWSHAQTYVKTVPHYKERLRLRPGISGYAQVKNGYADSATSIRRKACLDRIYVERYSIRLEMFIIFQTFTVMLTGTGAK